MLQHSDPADAQLVGKRADCVGQSANCAAQSTLLSPYPGRSTPIIRTPAAVSPRGNKQPGIGRELNLPWKAKHGTPSGSPLFPVRYL